MMMLVVLVVSATEEGSSHFACIGNGELMGRWGLYLLRRSFAFPLSHLAHERFSLVERASAQSFERECGAHS
jgi:hypothetical protein